MALKIKATAIQTIDITGDDTFVAVKQEPTGSAPITIKLEPSENKISGVEQLPTGDLEESPDDLAETRANRRRDLGTPSAHEPPDGITRDIYIYIYCPTCHNESSASTIGICNICTIPHPVPDNGSAPKGEIQGVAENAPSITANNSCQRMNLETCKGKKAVAFEIPDDIMLVVIRAAKRLVKQEAKTGTE